ncbi:MAG: hypothetical protein ACOYIE_06650 [Agathobaculum sp.]|jgi:cation transport ATPase|uniref:hypothetical protein n=1 Tax=Agathobaculum sp. TaxID=2048138 RepID=UPI003D8B77C1
MGKMDDTMNLDALKDLLNGVPDTDEFDLDSIIAEVEGRAPAAEPKQAPQPASEPPRPAPRRVEPQKQEAAAMPRAKEAQRARTVPQEETAPRRTAPKKRPVAQQEELPDLSAFTDEEDPRAARIAAREAKAAARREKAAAKAAVKAARRAAETEYDEQDDEAAAYEKTPSRSPRRAEKMTRKEAKAARIAAEQAEEEEDIELRDPAQAARSFKRRAQGLSARSTLVLLLTAAAAYISLAPGMEKLPLPTVLDISVNPLIGVGVLLLLQFIALFIGVDVFGMGFYSLFHGAPDRATLVSFAVLAALLHGASIIVFDNQAGVEIPYLAVSMLMLYAAMREERNRYAARARAYQAICSAEQPMAIYSHYDKEDDACRAAKGPLHAEDAFLTEMERPDSADRFAMIYVPIALAASIIFALLASVGRGEPVRFFWAFSAILSVSAPLGLLCAFGASYNNVSRRLLRSGAAIAGARQADLLRGTEEIVLTENDLFPAGSIALESLQNMGRISDDRILACAAALTDAAGLELGRVLTEATRERYGATLSARNVQMVEGGLAGEVGTSRVVLGTAALMVNMGMRIRAGQSGVHAYLVVNGELAGVLTLRYQPTKSTYQAMRLMRRMHMNAVLAVQDFNISPAMVESEFDLRRGFADQPAPDAAQRLTEPSYTEGGAPAAILTRDGAGPLVQVLRCADKLAGAVRSNLTLGAFAGICGMLIVFYLVSQNAVDALPVRNLLLYLLLWYAPVFLITQQTH